MIDFNRFLNIPPVCHWLQYRYPCQKPSADDWANAVCVQAGLDELIKCKNCNLNAM